MSTVKAGDEFRDDIFSLLRAGAALTVKKEFFVGGKKADIYCETRDTWGGIERVAIECKKYQKPLGNDDINSICSSYISAFQGNEIDRLIIISPSQPTSQGQLALKNYRNSSHLTYLEFQNGLIKFDRYLLDMKLQFSNRDLASYYIPPKSNNVDILTKIKNWISSDNYNPISVLASYGMGKSSLASALSSELSNNSCANNRIPILIKLGSLYSEQSIDGLISKHLTSDHKTEGYSFELFQELNRRGNFLIILDGFDEMKHAMSFHDFKENINQINSLIEGKAKLIILGRPNVFMSDNEKHSVLNGIKKIDNKEISETSFKNYIEINIDYFTEDDLKKFLNLYYSRPDYNINKDKIEQKIEEIISAKEKELFFRPVHAKMIADITATANYDISQIKRFSLYQLFIDSFFQREYGKRARKGFKISERWKFLQELSWSLWTNGGTSNFTHRDIPDRITLDIMKDSDLDKEQLAREFITGSFIEAKNDKLFFAHRSFHEFLVSKKISETTWTSKELKLLFKHLNNEIVSFINENPDSNNFKNSIYLLLSDYKDSISPLAIDLISTTGDLENIESPSIPQFMVLVNQLIQDINKPTTSDNILKILGDIEIDDGVNGFNLSVAIILMALNIIRINNLNNPIRLPSLILGICFSKSLGFFKYHKQSVSRGAQVASSTDSNRDFFINCISKSVSIEDKNKLIINFKEFAENIISTSTIFCDFEVSNELPDIEFSININTILNQLDNHKDSDSIKEHLKNFARNNKKFPSAATIYNPQKDTPIKKETKRHTLKLKTN